MPLLVADVIPVYGSGTFGCGVGDTSSVTFSGTDGTNTVFLAAVVEAGPCSPPISTLAAGIFPDDSGYASIDGVGSTLFTFSIGSGGGLLELYRFGDPTPIAEADLQAYITVVDFASARHFGQTFTAGTFDISGVPEPAAFGLALLAFAPLGLLARRRAVR